MALSTTSLAEALSHIDWNQHVVAFLSDASRVNRVERSSRRLAIWAKQFETADAGNSALSFVRDMQSCAQHVAALIGVALYKPAAASMRSMFEAALYYSYFRTHPVELAKLNEDASYFVQRTDVMDYHSRFTPQFLRRQIAIGFASRSAEWYKSVSRVVHGQSPGRWVEHTSLATIQPSDKLAEQAVEAFEVGEELIHILFLCTAGQDLWTDFSAGAKKLLLKGMTGEVKDALGLGPV